MKSITSGSRAAHSRPCPSAGGCGERLLIPGTWPLTQPCLPRVPTKTLTLVEMRSFVSTLIVGRKLGVQGLQSGQGELHIWCRFRSEPGCVQLCLVLTQELPGGVFAEGRKARRAILCPASGSPGLTWVSSRSRHYPALSPSQAGLGSWMQRE